MNILAGMGSIVCKPISFRPPTNLKLSTDQDSIILRNPKPYTRLAGRLLYLNLSLPDVFYAIQYLIQFVIQSRTPHVEATIHVVKYLKGIINKLFKLENVSYFLLLIGM